MITVQFHPAIETEERTVPEAIKVARESIHQGLDHAAA
jgi:hypothetical protein